MSTTFYKLYCRLFKIGLPPFQKWFFDNGSTAFSKWFGHLLKNGQATFQNYMAAFWKRFGSAAFSKQEVDRLLQIILSHFWKSIGRLFTMVPWQWINRLFKMFWPSFEDGSTMATFWKLYGRLFKMGRPLFQNGLIAFWKWVDRLLKKSSTAESLAAQSVGFWRSLCLQIRPSFVNRRLLNIVDPTELLRPQQGKLIGERTCPLEN